jgi:hypothetical protein
MRRYRVTLVALVCLLPARLSAQGTLEEAATRARRLWLAHDVAGLVAGSDTIRLQLPGVPYFAALAPGQAARLLDRYLEASREIALELGSVRVAGPDHGYAEGHRRYAVQGTSEEREEMVYLEFRLAGGNWHLREVRIVP